VTDEKWIEFSYDPDPAHPGWMIWGPLHNSQFNTLYEPIRVREAGPGKAVVRCMPSNILTSTTGNLHGGALAGFIDIALFAGARGCGIMPHGIHVTIDLSIQYLSPGFPDINLDAHVELTRETGRMAFMRGVVEQDGTTMASFMAVFRKGMRAG